MLSYFTILLALSAALVALLGTAGWMIAALGLVSMLIVLRERAGVDAYSQEIRDTRALLRQLAPGPERALVRSIIQEALASDDRVAQRAALHQARCVARTAMQRTS